MAGTKHCPVCGVSVKLANLESHIGRVHPGERVEAALTKEERQEVTASRTEPGPMSSTGGRAALVVVVLLVISVLAYAFWPSAAPDEPTDARIGISPQSYDFGNIPREIATQTFTVLSAGTDSLRITGISTSCGCTSAVLYANGRESPTFGMHNNPTGWSETLLPGQTAELTVFYDPNVHPDTGPVYRIIYIRSNDRAQPEVELELTANVVP